MTDPRTPEDASPAADPAPVDRPAEESPQVDSFAAEPPADPGPTTEQPVAPEPVAPEPPLLGGTPDPVPPAVDPIPAEPAEPVPPVAPAEIAAPAEPPPAGTAPAEPSRAEPVPPAPEDVPAERTLADEDPATPAPDSSDPVVLPPPAGEATDQDPGEGAAGPPAPTRRSRAWLPLAAIGTAVALLVAGTGYLAWQLRQDARAEQAREEATAAARDAARLLFSYDHETLEQDFEKGLSVTTGEFREQYRRTTTEVVTPVAEQYDAVVVAEVIEAAIVSASPDRATALVFLNQGTTSTRVQGQQVDQSRVRMQLVRRDGRWLVEGVGAL